VQKLQQTSTRYHNK